MAGASQPPSGGTPPTSPRVAAPKPNLTIEPPAADDSFFDEIGLYCFEHADHIPCAVGCDSIYVGSVRHATSVHMLRRFGITHVLNCAAGDCSVPHEELAARGIAYCAIEGKDEEDYPLLRNHLNRCLHFLHPCLMAGAGGKALVHCVAGRNRSATLAIAAVMYALRMPLQVCLRRLFRKRPFVLTNLSFRRQLKELAAAQGLLFAPQGLVRADWNAAGHGGAFSLCEHCMQPHVALPEARVDYELRADCSRLTVGGMYQVLAQHLRTPQLRIELDATHGAPAPPSAAHPPGAPQRAKPNSLLVPPTLDLPVEPFARVTLAELPRPIYGQRADGPAAILVVYDQSRKIVISVGIHDTRGAGGVDLRALP